MVLKLWSQTSSISVTWELVTNENYVAPPKPTNSDPLRAKPSNLYFDKSSR